MPQRLGGALVVLLAIVAGAAVAPAQDDWRLPGLEGGALTAADLARGNNIVVLWASWSPHCADIVERSNRIAGKWGGRARVVMVDFQEEPAEVSTFLAGKGAQVDVYLDSNGAFAKRYALANLPGLLVVRDGEGVYSGRLPDDPDGLIEERLGQR
jgi:thiol-disulfide isomerase/thioredoxin